MEKINNDQKKAINDWFKEINNANEENEFKKAELKLLLNQYIEFQLPPSILQKAFLIIANPDKDGYSKQISMTELVGYHISFHTNNGSTWSRTDSSSFLAKKYKIRNIKEGNSISAVKLDGLNESFKIERGIRKDIDREIKKRRCVILDISTNIETDHKNGKHNDQHMLDLNGQSIDDFQPLCKTANDAKRRHCNECINTHKRYDAKRLGYSHSFTKGDFDTQSCKGCYWYDPVEFNREISKEYRKDK